MRLWRITDCDQGAADPSWYYSHVVGAESPLEAMRKHVAAVKRENAEDTEMWRHTYEVLVSEGRSNGLTFDQFHQDPGLPQECMVVPMRDESTYHDRSISSDRKYEAEAFNQLWDWPSAVRVRL